MSEFKKINYPSLANQDARVQGAIPQLVMQEFDKMKSSREYMENEWNEANKAYQSVLDVYKRAFDPTEAPEIQFRNYFKAKDLSDIKLPVEFAVIQRKLTYILSNKPHPKWVAIESGDDDEKKSAGKMFGYAFDYAWYLCDGDWEEFKAIISSLIYSIGYLHWWYEYSVYDCEIPDNFENGVMTYKTVRKVISRPRVEHLDNRHVFLDYNASDISNVVKGGFIKHYDEATFKRLFGKMQIEGIMPITPLECFQKVGEEKSSQDKSVYECMYYIHEELDRYAIVVNGYHINPYYGPRIDPKNEGWSPIPSRDKRLPISFFIDHYLDAQLYGMGDCKLSKPFRELKNKTRNMVFDVMKKVAFHTMIIDPLSDFNEDEYEFGQPFIRAEVDSIKPLPVSANLDFSVRMDENVNNDLAVFTGINIGDTGNPDMKETATKTATRRESQFAMIETYIKQNMSYGWKRAWTGFKECLRIAGKVPKINENGEVQPMTVRTDGKKIFRGKTNPKMAYEKKMEGSYFFKMTPEDFDDEMELIPEIGNIAYTRELEDEKKREGLAILEKYAPGVVDLFVVGGLRAELHGLPANVIVQPPSAGPGKVNLNESPENIAKNLDLLAKPPQYDEMAAKLNTQAANPEAETPSKRIPEAGAVSGIQPDEQGNPAVVA